MTTQAAAQADNRPGVVVLGGGPIGNAADASARLVAALAGAAVIAAEDTRRLRRLASDLGVELTGRVVSFFDGNEERRVPELMALLGEGHDVLVISDAGMPSVSDPGYRLVVAALSAGFGVTALPGPSAVTTALALSGLPVDRYCFEGFLPRKPVARRQRLAGLAAEPRTMVFFESPHRIADSLRDLAEAFGVDRPAALCRELTKTYEQVQRLPLGELAGWAREGLRGEITLVVSGAPPVAAELSPEQWVAQVRVREEAGQSRKEAIAAVALSAGVAKRIVFDAVVATKTSGG